MSVTGGGGLDNFNYLENTSIFCLYSSKYSLMIVLTFKSHLLRKFPQLGNYFYLFSKERIQGFS